MITSMGEGCAVCERKVEGDRGEAICAICGEVALDERRLGAAAQREGEGGTAERGARAGMEEEQVERTGELQAGREREADGCGRDGCGELTEGGERCHGAVGPPARPYGLGRGERGGELAVDKDEPELAVERSGERGERSLDAGDGCQRCKRRELEVAPVFVAAGRQAGGQEPRERSGRSGPVAAVCYAGRGCLKERREGGAHAGSWASGLSQS